MSSNQNEPALIVFHGSMEGSPVEEAISRLQRDISLDLLSSAKLEHKILVTDSLEMSQKASSLARIEKGSIPFHFGRELQQLIKKYKIARPFYIGGGFPFLSTRDIETLSNLLRSNENCVIANNFYSADMVAFSPGSYINKVELPDSDNPLARLLTEQAGLRYIPLSRSVSNHFDIDTPTDLLLLGLHPEWKDRMGSYLKLDDSRLKAAMAVLKDKTAEALIFGRVNSFVWSRMESQTRCRVRLWAEERGLKSEGRQENRKARSLAGYLLEKMSFDDFFKVLSEMGNAAFIDTRVIFAHYQLSENRKDRFYSDIGNFQEIENNFIREFTRASVQCSIPVVLGGHSLVSGGMLLLLELMTDRL